MRMGGGCHLRIARPWALIGALTLLPPLLFATAVPAQAGDRYAIGDSVMLGARDALRARGFTVDAAVSRQAYVGPALLRRKGARLPENVVVHLGTNGTFPLATCKRMVTQAGPKRRVFLVTVNVRRSWERSNNAVLRSCDAAFPGDRVTVIEWKRAAAPHRAWFYSDGVHLRPSGRRAFARMISNAVDSAVRSAQEARRAALMNASGSGVAGLQG